MTLVVAEIGINHNGDMDIVRKLITIAAQFGCDYVKFQKRTPELCVPPAMRDKPKATPWGDMTYMEYKHRIELSAEDYEQIDNWCGFHNIGWYASAWDIPAASFLQEMGCSWVKIPSAKITDLELLDYCRNVFNHVVISTGMSTEQEIDAAVRVSSPEYLLHTHSAYPAPIEELDLNYMLHLKEKYPDSLVGYSGHEYGLVPSFAAVALGAQMIERHITLDRNMWGSDQTASIEPVGLYKLVRGIRAVEQCLDRPKALKSCERILWDTEKPKRKSLRG